MRHLDGTGRLVPPEGSRPLAVPRAEGPAAALPAGPVASSTPFGRPRLLTKDQLTEAAPAIALFRADELEVLYALRPDPSWGLDVELIPLLGGGALPYLVRGVDGPPGLYVVRPVGLRVPQTGTSTSPLSADDGGDGFPVIVLLGGAVAVGVVVTVVAARRRRSTTG